MKTIFLSAVLLVVGCVCVVVAQDSTSHSSHDHHSSHDEEGGHGFEEAAVYNMNMGTHNIIAVAAGESFEEESLAFMIVPTSAADPDGLEEAEEVSEAAWDAFASGAQEPRVLGSGDSAKPSDTVVYQVILAGDSFVTVPLEIADAGAYALFLEHGGDEVPLIVISPTGSVLVAGATEVGEDEDEEESSSAATTAQWANALVASLVLSACSFVGLLIVVNKGVANNIDLSHACMFASGSLLAASLLHIIPEALEGLESKYPDSLHDMGLHAGLAILAGVSFGILVHATLEADHSHSHAGNNNHDHHHHPETGTAGCSTTNSGSKAKGVALGSALPVASLGAETIGNGVQLDRGNNASNLQEVITASQGRVLTDLSGLHPVCWNVIIGDLVHNFADGVTIGAAFLSCSSTIGWTVTASAIAHELPHELADFMALINGGMSVAQAFLYNFLSALSCVLGVIIVLGLRDSLSSAQISFILLVGSGSFIFIGLAELLPQALGVSSSPSGGAGENKVTASKAKKGLVLKQMCKIVSFAAGAVLIGIPLMFDQHCEDAHSGHNH